jgi:hypothetical protein
MNGRETRGSIIKERAMQKNYAPADVPRALDLWLNPVLNEIVRVATTTMKL